MSQWFAIENTTTFQFWVAWGDVGRFSNYADEATLFATHAQASRQLVLCQRQMPHVRLRVRSVKRSRVSALDEV